MLLFYVRHGDPIYDPDSLTPLGERQAEAVARRLALHGVDRIFASTSNRAILTARPTAEIVKKEITLLDFANEKYAGQDFGVPNGRGGTQFAFLEPETARIMAGSDILKYGLEWYEHPKLKQYENFKRGVERVNRETDAFLASLGYEHDREENIYRITHGNDERVALFAHGGFGLAFISSVLGLPLPVISAHCHMGHSGVTVLEFEDLGGYSIPRMLTMSNDSHVYRDGLPLEYCNRIRF